MSPQDEYTVVAKWAPALEWDRSRCGRADGLSLRVELSAEKFNRQHHPDPVVEDQVQTRWCDLLAAKPQGSIWNQTKFRFAGLRDHSLLQLGITDYREYQGTNLSAKNPLKDAGWADPKHLAGAFGNACVVLTQDAAAALLVRGNTVGEAVGKAVFPGGHAEPSRLGIHQIKLKGEFPSEEDIVQELCESILEEVFEELFLERDVMVGNLQVLGITERAADFKAQLVGRMSCRMTATELQSHWSRKRTEKSEGVRLLLLDRPALLDMLSSGTTAGYEIMPEHHGALQLHIEVQ